MGKMVLLLLVLLMLGLKAGIYDYYKAVIN